MADIHAGHIQDSNVYTPEMLAKILGRTPQWVINLIDENSIAHRRAGRLRFVSGLAFRLWVEGQEAVGGETPEIY